MTAAIYRKAARIVERLLYPEEVGGYSCLAIAKVVSKKYTGRPSLDGFYYRELPAVKAYEDVFLYQYSSFGLQTKETQCARVLALCFMAAMVEAGDA